MFAEEKPALKTLPLESFRFYQYGEPIETSPTVVAHMTRPDGTTGQISLTGMDPGQFETSMIATQSGVYRFLVQAKGFTTRGEIFTREQMVTAVVGYPTQDPTGGQPGDGPGKSPDLCDLVHCLLEQGVLTDRFLRILEDKGIDVGRLRKCVERICAGQPPVIR